MKRQLFIIRHGKSSWESIVNDIDRPLTERGVNNSYEMALRLKKAGQIPQLIYSSPAARALHTAVIMFKTWDLPDYNLHISNQLYLPELNDIEELIYEIPDEVSSAAIFGHNPGFTEFANRFLPSPLENLPTAGVAIIDLELDSWTELFRGKITGTSVDFPKKGD